MYDGNQDKIVSEEQLISDILKFPEFERFYYNEWKTRDVSTRGKINPTFDEFAYQGFDEEGHYILLPKFPRTSMISSLH